MPMRHNSLCDLSKYTTLLSQDSDESRTKRLAEPGTLSEAAGTSQNQACAEDFQKIEVSLYIFKKGKTNSIAEEISHLQIRNGVDTFDWERNLEWH